MEHNGLSPLKDKQITEPYVSAECYLDIACKNLSVVNRAIGEYGDVSLSTYLENVSKPVVPSYQNREDLLKVVYEYTSPLLGNSVARRAASDLSEHPVLLTANHHGACYFSQSIQASIIFSLNTLSGEINTTTVPVFSCGNVPLNNLEYPRGLLIYETRFTAVEAVPRKLPVFPDRFKRQMVSAAPAFDEIMIRTVEARLDKMIHEGQISTELADSIHEIFREDYRVAMAAAMPSYSQQLVVLNNRIWKRLFSEVTAVPEMICLEIEKIAAILLGSDLANPTSLARCVMFKPSVREHVLKALDGVRGCWDLDKLEQRVQMNLMDKLHDKATDGCGTVFFWGIDSFGRRIPLYLETEISNREVLRGVDDRGNLWELPYSCEEIIKNLDENRLLPSLFTCYLVMLARGVTCVGGYFQCVYLPQIQQSLIAALQQTGNHDIARFVGCVSTDCYLQGMLAVMSKTKDGGLIPSGPLEIIAGGGITNDDIEKMLSLTVREAHLAALFETVRDGVPPTMRSSNWKKHLAADCSRLLKDKVVVK